MVQGGDAVQLYRCLSHRLIIDVVLSSKGISHNGMANFKPCESDFMKVFRPEMEDLPQIMGNMILMVLNHVGWNGHLWQRLSTRRVWRCCF